MIAILIYAALAVFVADSLYSRARIRLRMRAAQAATQRPSHHLTGGTGSSAWHDLHEDAERSGAADEHPFEGFRFLGNNSRRPPQR